MGKSTISMAIFNSKLLVIYQSVVRFIELLDNAWVTLLTIDEH